MGRTYICQVQPGLARWRESRYLGRWQPIPTPNVKMTVPSSMPNLRPRRSAMGANRGLVAPISERPVINKDMVEISTPKSACEDRQKRIHHPVGCIQDGAQEHEDDELKADAQEGLFACFQGSETKRVKKYAAIHARIFSTTKKIMIFHKPELKIGDGGGCITF